MLLSTELELLHSEHFDSYELKNRLDPIFESTGYRDSESNNILIVHDAGIGDFINLSPAVKAIRKNFPTKKIFLYCNKALTVLVESCPYVDKIFYDDSGNIFESFQDSFAYQIRQSQSMLQFKFDIAFCFCHYCNGILLAYLSGAKKVVHYNGNVLCNSDVWNLQYVITLVNHPIQPDFETSHIADRYLNLVEQFFNESITDRKLEVWYQSKYKVTVENILATHNFTDNLIAICMGGSFLAKKFPPEKYAQLAKFITVKIPSAKFVIVGSNDDSTEAETFKKYFADHQKILDLTGKLNYAESAEIISRCKIYIGNDTGVMHIAAAEKIPCLVPYCFPADHEMLNGSVVKMYSPYKVSAVMIQPKKSLPECSDNHTLFGCQILYERHCISQIEVETMFVGFELLLELINNNDERSLLIC